MVLDLFSWDICELYLKYIFFDSIWIFFIWVCLFSFFFSNWPKLYIFPTWICQVPTPPDLFAFSLESQKDSAIKKNSFITCSSPSSLCLSPPPPSHSYLSLSLLRIHGFHGCCLYFPAGSSSPSGLSLYFTINLESPAFSPVLTGFLTRNSQIWLVSYRSRSSILFILFNGRSYYWNGSLFSRILVIWLCRNFESW